MNAKQKAKDLVNKVSIEMEQLPYSFCKALATFMVKEIIKECYNYSFEHPNLVSERVVYWHSVIAEIDEL